MNKNWLAAVLLVCVIVSLSALFWIYWTKYRPAEIEELCSEEAKMNVMHPRPSDDPMKRRVRTYEQCLEENGITK